MNFKEIDPKRTAYVLLPPILVCAVSLYLKQFNYLAFHIAAELFAIIIGFSVLTVAMAAHNFNLNNYILFVSIVIGWVSGIDLAHTLLYEGMGIFHFENSNIPTQLWILARSLQAVGMAMAPIYLSRPFKVWKVWLCLFAVTALAVICIQKNWFPVTHVAGVGLTPFKIYAEYVIILVFLIAALLIYQSKKSMTEYVWKSLIVMIVFSIASELSFTRYVSVYGPANMIGHLFKIFAFWALYLALIDNSLRRPFDTLAKTVSSYDALPFAIITVGPNRRILQANAKATQWAGASKSYLVGKDSHALFHDVYVSPDRCPICTHQGEPNSTREFEIPIKHGTRQIKCSVTQVQRGEGKFVQIQMLRELPVQRMEPAA